MSCLIQISVEIQAPHFNSKSKSTPHTYAASILESIQRSFYTGATLPMMDLGLLRYFIKLDITLYKSRELVLQTLRSINTTTLILLSLLFVLVSPVSSVLLTHRLRTQEGQGRRPPQVPYTVPVVGNLLTFLRAPHHLAASIT